MDLRVPTSGRAFPSSGWFRCRGPPRVSGASPGTLDLPGARRTPASSRRRRARSPSFPTPAPRSRTRPLYGRGLSAPRAASG